MGSRSGSGQVSGGEGISQEKEEGEEGEVGEEAEEDEGASAATQLASGDWFVLTTGSQGALAVLVTPSLRILGLAPVGNERPSLAPNTLTHYIPPYCTGFPSRLSLALSTAKGPSAKVHPGSIMTHPELYR